MNKIITDKGTIEPINEEQRVAIERGIEYLKKGDPNKWFVLEGKAGTGKTTIMTKILEEFIGKKRIEICALAHKAKKVLWSKITDNLIDIPAGLSSNSVASLLGMKLNMETGKFTKEYSKKKPPIRWADIIIVDEASMINEQCLLHIMDNKKAKAKVIFVGDIGQLPPIRENNDSLSSEPSPVFLIDNKCELRTRVRQDGDSKILPYSDYYWDNSVIKKGEEEDPIPLEERKSNKSMIFSKDFEDVINKTKDKFIQSVKTNNTNIIKVIVYRNKTKKMVNAYIRSLIFENPKEYEIGELLMFNDNYFRGDRNVFENSTEVSVLKIKDTIFNGEYHGKILTVTDGDRNENIEVISSGSVNGWNKHVSKLFEVANKTPKGVRRNRLLKTAWGARNRFANVDYSYTITSHKSQGSTYETSIVIEDDILDTSMITNIEKSQSLYVAISRASKLVYIISELN